MLRLILPLLLAFTFASPGFQPVAAAPGETMQVEISGVGARPIRAEVPTTRVGAVRYASAGKLAAAFTYRTWANTPARKLTLYLPEHEVVLTAGSPFVLLKPRTGSAAATVQQLPLPVTVGADSADLTVPVEAFVGLLNTVFDGSLRYDAGANRLSAALSRFDVTDLTAEVKRNGTLIRVKAARPLKEYQGWTTEGGWVYLTLVGVKGDLERLRRWTPPAPIRRVRVEQFPGSLQLAFQLPTNPQSTDFSRATDGNDVLITLVTPADVQSISLDETRRREEEARQQREQARWKLDTIVLDAGHGGKDPGAIGPGGTHEADVTLAIVRRLGPLLESKLGVKVVYTRQDNRFIDLYERGQIGNRAKGKLFISIHCNSGSAKAAGFETYLLRPGKSAAAISVAARENGVIGLESDRSRYAKLTDEYFILSNMAQSAFVQHSERFAGGVQRELDNVLSIPNRGVSQAGFLVLWAASMPSVLIETGFISNPTEEKLLRSDAGQQRYAEAIATAVSGFRDEYERNLTGR